MNIFIIYFVIAQILWGILPVFWKQLAMLDPLYILAVRIIFSAIFCGLLIRIAGKETDFIQAVKDRQIMQRLAAAGLFITMNWGLYIYAVNTGHIFEASLAYFINPIVCLAASAVFLKEHLGPFQKTATAVASAGILLSFVQYGEIPWLALAICITFSVYSILKKSLLVDSQVSVCIETLYMVIPSAVLIGWMEHSGNGAVSVLSGAEWLLLPAAGVVTSLPLLFFSAGIKGTPFSVSAIFMYLSPVIQLFLAPLYGEELSSVMLMNFLFALTAVALFIFGSLRDAARLKAKLRRSFHEDKKQLHTL